MKNPPIGILDSGVGGLSIWREITRQLPEESTVYIADSKNCPYGVRSADEIYSLGKQLVQFLVEKKVKLVVVACNTITVTCLSKLRHDFPNIPLVGTVPVIKTASEKTKTKKVGVLSTTATAKSLYQKNLIYEFANDIVVKTVGIDTIVPFVERGDFASPKLDKILQKTLVPFTHEGFDVLALGCSHFPLVKDQMQEIVGKDVLLLDSGGAIARQVGRVLNRNKALGKGKPVHSFFTTGDKKQFALVAQKVTDATISGSISYVRL